MNQPVHQYGLPSAISASALIYTGPGTLQSITISSHTNGTIKFWDSLAGSGTVLVDTYTYPAGSSVVQFSGLKFKTGLFADMNSTTQKITVNYNPYVGG